MTVREKVPLRKQLGGAELHSILQYMKDFGHGRTTAEQTSGNIVLYVDDARDVDLLRHQFAELLETEANHVVAVSQRQGRRATEPTGS